MADILITRPQDSALAFQNDLTALGLTSMVSPVLEIIPRTEALSRLSPDDYTGVVITSAHGLRGLELLKSLPLYCVGEQSAQAAKQAGFETITCANGTAADLEILIKDTCTPDTDKLLYCHGDHLSYPLHDTLSAHGFTITSQTTYHSQTIRTLEDQALRAIQDSSLKAITFFSKRTASHFMDLVKHHNLEAQLCHFYALCLSQSVIECVRTSEEPLWKETYAAATPDREGMLKLCASLLK